MGLCGIWIPVVRFQRFFARGVWMNINQTADKARQRSEMDAHNFVSVHAEVFKGALILINELCITRTVSQTLVMARLALLFFQCLNGFGRCGFAVVQDK